MRKILLFISVVALMAFTGRKLSSTSVVITPNSKLFIIGKTNVSSFKCRYDVEKLEKPIPVFYKKVGNNLVFDNTVLVLNNADFDCGGHAINADFNELLKTDTYPQLFINLKEISNTPKSDNDVLAKLNIEIAGIKKEYSTPVTIKGSDAMLVKGVLNLNLRDFNLEPPKKALGLIVVKDVIEINFELVVTENE